MSANILVVDDDPGLRKLVKSDLAEAGYRAVLAEDAGQAMELLVEEKIDLALLDVELPGLSGFMLLETWRNDARTQDLPVIMLTVRSSERDKVRGLKAGADDYLVKPFSRKELLARVEAVLRRSSGVKKPSEILSAGPIRVDVAKHEAYVRTARVTLRPTEFDLLCELLKNKGYVVAYSKLTEALSRTDKPMSADNLYFHVTNLRKKLGAAGELIENLQGSGYKFRDE